MVKALIVVVALLGLVGVMSAQDAEGARLITTIEIAEQTEGFVSFDVTRSIPYDKETIWVKNQCWDADGDLAVSQDAAVLWGTTESLVGTTGLMPIDGETCTAYVTLRPWQKKSSHAPTVTF